MIRSRGDMMNQSFCTFLTYGCAYSIHPWCAVWPVMEPLWSYRRIVLSAKALTWHAAYPDVVVPWQFLLVLDYPHRGIWGGNNVLLES